MIQANLKINTILGKIEGLEPIGMGSSRCVYPWSPSSVVKICDYGDFSNIREFEVFNSFFAYQPVLDWIAPVRGMTACGRGLIMARTTHLHSSFPMPMRVPNWMTDLKRSNFGTLNGKMVAHDYASHLLLGKGASRRMMRAKWRDE